MQQHVDTIRELSVAELDQVGGGQSELSIGGLNELIDTVHSIPSGFIEKTYGLVGSLVGGLLGAVGGVAGR